MTSGISGQGFEVRAEAGAEAGARVVLVLGELDSSTCNELGAVVQQELDDPMLRKLVLNLQRMLFVDSSGMRTLIDIERKASERGIGLDVVPARDEVTALLAVAGLTERMNLVVDPDGAVPPEGFVERVDFELEREQFAPSRARAEVREVLGSTLEEHDLATVVLLTSELVTNAVVHPRDSSDRRLGLRLTIYPKRLRVEVDDPGQGFDPTAPVEPTDHGGRGLMLVDRASSRWGAGRMATPRGLRFAVWFESGTELPDARAVEA